MAATFARIVDLMRLLLYFDLKWRCSITESIRCVTIFCNFSSGCIQSAELTRCFVTNQQIICLTQPLPVWLCSGGLGPSLPMVPNSADFLWKPCRTNPAPTELVETTLLCLLSAQLANMAGLRCFPNTKRKLFESMVLLLSRASFLPCTNKWAANCGKTLAERVDICVLFFYHIRLGLCSW